MNDETISSIEKEEEIGENNSKATQDTAQNTSENSSEAAKEVKCEVSVEEQLQKQLSEAEDRHLRLLAEFDNYRKRTQKEKLAAFKESEAAVITKLLPVLDNFERAMSTPCEDEAYSKGVCMIHSTLVEIMTGYGLEKFGAVGEKFDPSMHNAVAHIEDDTLEKNVISQVFQDGYRIGSKILRYAMVQTAN